MKRINVPIPLSPEEKEIFAAAANTLNWPLSRYVRISSLTFAILYQTPNLSFKQALEKALLLEKDGRTERKNYVKVLSEPETTKT